MADPTSGRAPWVLELAVTPLARSLATATLAGFAAGVIAGGAGSRLAMRISAITAGSAQQGALTEFEATVGDITPGGTIFLLLLGGFVGALGGLIYLALRPWLADAGRWRGLAFGLLFPALFGATIIDGGNPDFHLFGPPALNITMFASIFALFGVLVVLAFDWIQRIWGWLPPPSLRGAGRISLAAQAFGVFLLLPAVPSIGIVAQGAGAALLPYVLLVVPIASAGIARAAGRFEGLSDLRDHPRALATALAVLALPLLAGLALDGRAVADIFRAAG